MGGFGARAGEDSRDIRGLHVRRTPRRIVVEVVFRANKVQGSMIPSMLTSFGDSWSTSHPKRQPVLSHLPRATLAGRRWERAGDDSRDIRGLRV